MASEPPPSSALLSLVERAATDSDWRSVAALAASHAPLATYRPPPRRGDKRRTALHAAVDLSAPSPTILSILAANPGAASLRDAEGSSPLHTAAWRGASVDVVRALLEAEPSAAVAADWYGNTPLHLAILHLAPPDVVRLLSEASGGEAVVTRSHRGGTPLHDALIHSPSSAGPVEAMLSARPDAATVRGGGRGEYPLHAACRAGACPDAVRAVLRRGPRGLPLGWRDGDGSTPLELLCHRYDLCLGDAVFRLDGGDGFDAERALSNPRLRRFWEAATDMILWGDGGGVGSGFGGYAAAGGGTLVHAALRAGEAVPTELLLLIFRVNRRELGVADAAGDLPLHIASRLLPGGGRAGNRAGGRPGRPVAEPYDPARDLLALHPPAAGRSDSAGRLPLRIMVEAGRTWRVGVRDAVRAHPAGVASLRLDVRLMPNVLGCIAEEDMEEDGNARFLDCAFLILKEMPDVVRFATLSVEHR